MGLFVNRDPAPNTLVQGQCKPRTDGLLLNCPGTTLLCVHAEAHEENQLKETELESALRLIWYKQMQRSAKITKKRSEYATRNSDHLN